MRGSNKDLSQLSSLALYSSPGHACHYLARKVAITQFADPTHPMTTALYSQLADYGFRRSGEFVYRPRCPACEACVPVRIPVQDFAPHRSQRRTWKINQDLTVTLVPAQFQQDHFELYQRYITTKHPEGDMAPEASQYKGFLISSWCQTQLIEFRLAQRLLAVAVVDVLNQGLSAVYTYYDPEMNHRSLGTYAVLWQIHHAQTLALPWLYLGYWIAECPKMAYKINFHPLEKLIRNKWLPLNPR